jgi:hypothetical protein
MEEDELWGPITASHEVVCFGSRDPPAFWRIPGSFDRLEKTRDPLRRDPGYQSASASIFIEQRLSLYSKILINTQGQERSR